MFELCTILTSLELETQRENLEYALSNAEWTEQHRTEIKLIVVAAESR